MKTIHQIEARRQEVQNQLDAAKTSEERNRMGQFATPPALAREIVAHGLQLLSPAKKIRFLDPAIGTGSFYSALRATVPGKSIDHSLGFEIDEHYGAPAKSLWAKTSLDIQLQDFTKASPQTHPGLSNLLICNPPYVRHHHLGTERKAELLRRAEEASGTKINGLSGLYCYFMAIAHQWMAPGAVAGWLIPSEFMGVNYGRKLKSYLLEKVSLLQIHRFDPEDVQFTDALVSSAVVWIRNEPPSADHTVTFSYGGTLANPALSREVPASQLVAEPKWTRYPQRTEIRAKAEITLGDLFDIKRGLATGDNNFFIMDRSQIEERHLPMELFTPVLPGSRHLPDNEIHADAEGLPQIKKQLFLLHTSLPEHQIAERYPELKTYLDSGSHGENPVSQRYLCRSRKLWYSQENRPAAPIICTYMGRSSSGRKPFRFLLNHSRATATNVFLMLYPKPFLARAASSDPAILRCAWEFLNGIDPADLLGHGRVYGGGLHKLEPKELRGLPAEDLLSQLPAFSPPHHQLNLFQKAVA